MTFLLLGYAIADRVIVGVNLHNACTQPVISVSAESKMLGQVVANFAGEETVLEEIHLKNVLLLAMPPCEPCLPETDMAANVEQCSATTTTILVTAQVATLGLSHPCNLDVRPDQIGIQGEPTSLQHIQNGIKVMSLFVP